MKPHLTDIAPLPPEGTYFQKNRETIEKRSGRWLRELGLQSQSAGFKLERWIAAWDQSAVVVRPHG